MKIHIYYVYILSNKYDTVFYTGMTNNLKRRMIEHKQKMNPGFTSQYNVDKLIYFEVFSDVTIAIQREKQIKKYSRMKKKALVNTMNPALKELYVDGKISKPELPDH